MAEISTDDLEVFTDGRLVSTDQTEMMLTAALSVFRREVGWHVSPVHEDETLVLDGPDSRILWLPTMKVDEVTSIEEDGVALDMADVRVSVGGGPYQPRPVAARKSGGAWWTAEYGAIEVVMTHGFTETEANDWRHAVLSAVDQMSLMPVQVSTGASGFGVTSQRVDDVAISYSPAYINAAAEDVVFSFPHILEKYRLPVLELL
jgi:hypothetical protein